MLPESSPAKNVYKQKPHVGRGLGCQVDLRVGATPPASRSPTGTQLTPGRARERTAGRSLAS